MTERREMQTKNEKQPWDIIRPIDSKFGRLLLCYGMYLDLRLRIQYCSKVASFSKIQPWYSYIWIIPPVFLLLRK